MAYADFIGPQRTTIIESWQRKRCSYQAVYDSPGPGWYGCSLTLYYSPSSSCPPTSSVRGYFTAQDCSWPNSCNYYGSACVVTKTFDGVEGCTQGQPGCTRVEDITNLPPATVSGSFTCTTPGANGWCLGGGALDLSASEPLTGYVITLIENDTGTLCDPPDAANVACTWDQAADGSYTVEFWAHSSYGDTSAKGSAVWRQDTAGPVSTFTDLLEGSTTPASGVVNLSGTSVDAVSGVAGAEIWVEGGGGWQPRPGTAPREQGADSGPTEQGSQDALSDTYEHCLRNPDSCLRAYCSDQLNAPPSCREFDPQRPRLEAPPEGLVLVQVPYFDAGSVDWIDLLSNLVGIAGDVGLVAPPAGTYLWYVTEVVEVASLGRDLWEFAEGDPWGISTTITGLFIEDVAKLFPGAGAVPSMLNIAWELLQGVHPIYEYRIEPER